MKLYKVYNFHDKPYDFRVKIIQANSPFIACLSAVKKNIERVYKTRSNYTDTDILVCEIDDHCNTLRHYYYNFIKGIKHK